jgi:amidase/nitrilase
MEPGGFEPGELGYDLAASGSMLVNPAGVVKAGPLLNKEGLLTAEFERDQRRAVKAYFDAMGHYTRWEAVNLEVSDATYDPIHDHHGDGDASRVRRVGDTLGRARPEPARLEVVADEHDLSYEAVEAVVDALAE